MSIVDDYICREGDTVRVGAEAASRFAKEVAGDFNPIHDPDNRRFCVPGDLLFALVVGHYGLSPRMEFRFNGMVGADTPLALPEADGEMTIADTDGREYLTVARAPEPLADPAVAEALVRGYVAFSGQNFPWILQPLMAEQGVMFNPDRPLIIYDSMAFELLEGEGGPDLDVELADSSMEVDGKRGDVHLAFRLTSGGRTVGHGSKRLVVSGLRPYDETRMAEIIETFDVRKAAYFEEAGAV
ncbi:Protein of unknown function [Thiohalospira halophila DSM 15071]|uniref:DUF3581 domain-containing protein n=1 Tax=Thiohalospira halophila DSM 15071 TaxID=1123397 RepID=A0A1I1NJ11_9GAMM|nr:Protein of unknown function [Thiohalospira halophila DSM 15071]